LVGKKKGEWGGVEGGTSASMRLQEVSGREGKPLTRKARDERRGKEVWAASRKRKAEYSISSNAEFVGKQERNRRDQCR